MSRRSIFALLVVSALAACTSPSRTPAPSGPGQVRLTLTCAPDGTLSFSIDKWSVALPNKSAAFTFINDPSSNADGQIAANNPQYPFAGRQFTAHHGSDVVAKPVSGTPAGTYKYSITVACPVAGGPPQTTVIDPDMIIPWKIE